MEHWPTWPLHIAKWKITFFGPAIAEHEQPAPEEREEAQHAAVPATIRDKPSHQQRRSRRGSNQHRDQVWQAIEATPDFWTTLKPIDKKAIKRLYHLMGEHKWEVFFITQRPATAGGTVQWQTQKWLIDHGFPTPSVIPLSRGRGKAASVLHLDYLVDDTPQNCVDVLADSTARSILLIGRKAIRSPTERQAPWNRHGAGHQPRARSARSGE